jgi:hypothetical protein
MKITLLFLACLFTLAAGRAEGAYLFATASIERLSVEDYQLDLYSIVYPSPADYPAFDWDSVSPRSHFTALTGNFSPSPYLSYYDYNVSVVIRPDATTLFLSLYAQTSWVFEGQTPGGYPDRRFVDVSGQANFFAALPQEIGTSSTLIQTPEASTFVLLFLGLLPLGFLLTSRGSLTEGGRTERARRLVCRFG